MAKKIVVSAIFNSHDYIKDPVLDGFNEDWEYHLFTDDESIESEYWQIHLIGGDRAKAREIKINTHKFIGYDYCLWVDASIVLKGDPEKLLEEMGDKHFMFKVHPNRETTSQEIKACVKHGKIEIEDAVYLRDRFEGLGYTKAIQDTHTVYETGLYLKKNTSIAIEFCTEWYIETLANLCRDQLSLPYCLWKLNPPIQFFTEAEFYNYGQLSAHSNNYNLLENIRYVSPYAIDGNLGAAYNQAGKGLDYDDWVCIIDQDICFLDSRLKLWIAMCLNDNPEFDVFTCVTNRLADKQQLPYATMYEQTNIVIHKKATLQAQKTFGTKVVEATHATAGLFMLMKRRTLEAVGFKNGLIYLDTDFYQRATAMGFKFGIMKGVYVFHYYRLAEGKSSIGHLQRISFK